jgi:hypothetical protein
MTQKKKKFRIMRNMEKIKKQSALGFGIINRFGLGLGILGVVAALIYAFGAPVPVLIITLLIF